MDWVTTGRYNKRMAKRMFSDEITTTDAFLDMPSESQLLYFHIGMTADDDGFIGNAKMIQRSIGASDDSMKILIVKKFIISFNNGVMVVKHWRINNFIRGDIYKETKYLDQRKLLNMRDNGSYSLNKDNAIPLPRGYVTIEKIKEMNRLPELESSTVTEPLQNSNLDKIRLDKIRLDKIRLDKIIEDKESYGESGLVKMTIEEHQKLIEAITETNTKILIEELDDYLGTMTPKKRENKYASHYKAIRQWARKRYKENQSDKLSVKGKNAF